MDRIGVKSSNVESVGYDPDTKTLQVSFKNGGVYNYAGVEPEKHKDLMAAKSIGGFIHTHIKGKHAHRVADISEV